MARNDCPCPCHSDSHCDFNFSCGMCYSANHMAHLNKKQPPKPKPTARVKRSKPAAKAVAAPASEPKKA